jgi:hypothetical protein
VVFAPVVPVPLAAAVYGIGSLVCHQLSERSFHWHGAQLAVCARCTGIYLGACAIAVVAPLPPSSYAWWAATPRRIRTAAGRGPPCRCGHRWPRNGRGGGFHRQACAR